MRHITDFTCVRFSINNETPSEFAPVVIRARAHTLFSSASSNVISRIHARMNDIFGEETEFYSTGMHAFVIFHFDAHSRARCGHGMGWHRLLTELVNECVYRCSRSLKCSRCCYS